MHNLHKIKRVLQKTNFPNLPTDEKLQSKFNQQLEQGDPSLFSDILKHVIFRSSRQMVQHLVEKGTNPKVEYLSEFKFMKAA